MAISKQAMNIIIAMQQNEINEHYIYKKISKTQKTPHNKEVLERLSQEEKKHYDIWMSYSKKEVPPQKLKIFFRCLCAKVFGFTFVIKLMERGEHGAGDIYKRLADEIPQSEEISKQENEHESALIEILDEERLQYVGSMVLGLNDALVELTGTLAGLTLAMANTRIIALSGLITGISATLSMASSEYLSAKSEGRPDALKSSAYTGLAYVMTVAMLIMPYLIFPPEAYLWALLSMLVIVVLIIVVFNYYISVAKGLPFKKRFCEMATISLGVAALSFLIGIFVKKVLGIEM